LIFCTPSID